MEEIWSYLLVISLLIIVPVNIFWGSHNNKWGCSNELQHHFIEMVSINNGISSVFRIFYWGGKPVLQPVFTISSDHLCSDYVFIFAKILKMIYIWLYFGNSELIIGGVSGIQPNASAILSGRKDLLLFQSWWHYQFASRQCGSLVCIACFCSDENVTDQFQI